jgi:2-methylisocitrate lyase-like PEP mutase family enzyme
MLQRDAILEQPSVCDPLGARMAQDAGFEAVTLAGYAIGAHLPLTGSLNFTEIERATLAITQACAVPVVIDADVTWTDAGSVADAVLRLERVGAAAVQVGSQHLPDGLPFFARAERRKAHCDLVDRVEAAVSARGELLIVARCDVEGEDYPGTVRRARDLVAAGADGLVVWAADDRDLRQLPIDLAGTPLIYAVPDVGACARSVFPVAQLASWGYRGVRNKYHGCYCARMLERSAADVAPTQ